MIYVHSCAENIPFPNNYFDVISSFNSLDHVDNLDMVVSQIKSKLKTNGLFLLLTDVNHEPTQTEPISYSWNITSKFKPEFELLSEKHFEKKEGMYQSIEVGKKYDHDNPVKRYGVLSAKFIKR